MRTLLIFVLLAIACALVNCRVVGDESESWKAKRDYLLARDTKNKKKTKSKAELKISFPLFKKKDNGPDEGYGESLFRKRDQGEPIDNALFKKLDQGEPIDTALFKKSDQIELPDNALFRKWIQHTPMLDYQLFKRWLQVTKPSSEMSKVEWFKNKRQGNPHDNLFEPFKRRGIQHGQYPWGR